MGVVHVAIREYTCQQVGNSPCHELQKGLIKKQAERNNRTTHIIQHTEHTETHTRKLSCLFMTLDAL